MGAEDGRAVVPSGARLCYGVRGAHAEDEGGSTWGCS